MNKLRNKIKNKKGFTLVEMLIVVAIIAILVVVSIPLVNSSLNKAKVATNDANVRAAKAAANVLYLEQKFNDGETVKTEYYYDAESGSLVDEKTSITSGYGQATTDPEVQKDAVIKVSIALDTGAVNCTWESLK